MMYHKQFVTSVKVAGKIMREQKEVVLLPFGTDYSLIMKNLSTKRARVGVTIDGEDVLGGNNLVVNPNEDYELERWILNGNLSSGPKFRFIEKTGKISEARGDRVDDGLVRVTYAFELVKAPLLKLTDFNYGGTGQTPSSFHYGDTLRGGGDMMKGGGPQKMGMPSTFSSQVRGQSLGNVVPDSISDPVAESEVGITTKGAESNQTFTRTSMGVCGEEHVIVLYLRGTNDSGKLIVEPVDVKRKHKCETCGTINRSGQKFCGNCGTNLDW